MEPASCNRFAPDVAAQRKGWPMAGAEAEAATASGSRDWWRISQYMAASSPFALGPKIKQRQRQRQGRAATARRAIIRRRAQVRRPVKSSNSIQTLASSSTQPFGRSNSTLGRDDEANNASAPIAAAAAAAARELAPVDFGRRTGAAG